MTLEQLRIFLAVAERQHVTQAAEALNLTQSAVSAAISALEARHGVHLFDRVGRRIELTEAGRLFVPEARAVLDKAETASLMLADLAEQTSGRIRIHASQTVASYWLPERLVRFHTLHPQVAIDLTVGNTTQVARAVTEGAADLGVVEGTITQKELAVETVATDTLVVVVAPDHPFAKAGTVDLGEMRRATWILREAGSGTRAEFENWLTAHGIHPEELEITLALPSNEAVLAAIAAGSGAGVLSERAVSAAVTAGRVAALPLAGAERHFFTIRHRARHRTKAVAALEAMFGEDVE